MEASSINPGPRGMCLARVQTMNNMFAYSRFDQPIGEWDVANVATFESMFASTRFNQDIGAWQTGTARSMERMFANNPVFQQDISSWNVTSVRRFSHMLAAPDAVSGAGDSEKCREWRRMP